MKYKLTIAIVITVLLIVGGIAETIFVSKTFNEFSARLDSIMEDDDYSYDKIKDTESWWKKRVVILEISIPHVQLQEITVTYGELVGAMEEEDFDSANALLNRIYQYSQEINKAYGFRALNVL